MPIFAQHRVSEKVATKLIGTNFSFHLHIISKFVKVINVMR